MPATVLIADDDAVQRRLVENMVQRCGHDTVVVDSGDAALAALIDPDAKQIDAVVLDLVMPGLDGLGVLARIREAGLSIPGIVQTIATLFILYMCMFLSADLYQIFNMQYAVNASTIDILDTYVYRMGLLTGEYALATAAGLFKAVIGMILVVTSHLVSKRLTGKGLW